MSQPIPRPPGVPLLGNLFNVNPSNTWDSLKKLSEEYGEIFQIKVLGHGIVFVASAALAEELCDEKRFRKYVGGPVVEIRAAVHDALFTAYDHEESWGIAHRIIAPKLTPQSMADRFEEMRDTATELIDKWRVLGEDNEVSLIGELNRLNLEATTLTLYGKKLNCLDGPEHPMIKRMEDSTSEAMKRPTRPGLVNWFLKGKFNKSIKVMRMYAQEMVDHRKAHPSLDGRNDLLSVLMNGKDPQTSQSLRESQVIDNIVSMPIGSSTAPALVSTAIYFLLKNPHVIVTARQEIEFVLAGGELTYAHLSQLHYIEGIMRESLRLSFAAPGFNIEPIPREHDTSPVVLGQGKYQVAHNQPMIIVLAGVNRDPAVFQDPLAFVPERMMGETFDNLPVSVKKWFGNGKRECIGKHYAWQWNMVALTKLIRGVNFAMVDPNYELKQDGWFNLRPVDFMVKVRSV